MKWFNRPICRQFVVGTGDYASLFTSCCSPNLAVAWCQNHNTCIHPALSTLWSNRVSKGSNRGLKLQWIISRNINLHSLKASIWEQVTRGQHAQADLFRAVCSQARTERTVVLKGFEVETSMVFGCVPFVSDLLACFFTSRLARYSNATRWELRLRLSCADVASS